MVYFAGHGCADTKRYFVLNEPDAAEAFWPAEGNLLQLGTLCGSALKEFILFDICWEPKEITEENILKFQKDKAIFFADQAPDPPNES